MILNDGSPTRIDPATCNTSAIDMSICSDNLARRFIWRTLSDTRNSDQFSLTVCIPKLIGRFSNALQWEDLIVKYHIEARRPNCVVQAAVGNSDRLYSRERTGLRTILKNQRKSWRRTTARDRRLQATLHRSRWRNRQLNEIPWFLRPIPAMYMTPILP